MVRKKRTFVAVVGFFVVAFFLVTPAGLLPVTGAAFFALGLVAFLRTTAGAVSTCWKTRGVEWPVCERVPSRAMVMIVLWCCGGGWVGRRVTVAKSRVSRLR